MNMKTSFMTFVLVTGLSLVAATQWSPEDFAAMAMGDGGVMVDAKAAGSSQIIILSNTIGMGTPAEGSFDDIYMYHWYRENPNMGRRSLSIYPLANYLDGVGPEGGVFDLSVNGKTLQEGDIIEFTRNKWNFDYSTDAISAGMTNGAGNSGNASFNPDYGVNNYFQSYGNGSGYDGAIDWTFGVAMDSTAPPTVQPGGQVSGQPLPGVLATMLIGGATAVAVRKKRKDTVA